MMPEPAAVFAYGIGCGLALLLISSYCRISPLWLRCVLSLSAILLILRFSAAALSPSFSPALVAQTYWPIAIMGLLAPSLFCWDQLVRHPLYTPKKLLLLTSPLLFIELVFLIFAAFQATPQGGIVHILNAGLGALAAIALGVFFLKTASKIPDAIVRRALVSLALVPLCVVFQPILSSAMAPFAAFDLLAIACLWFGFDSIRQAQQTF